MTGRIDQSLVKGSCVDSEGRLPSDVSCTDAEALLRLPKSCISIERTQHARTQHGPTSWFEVTELNLQYHSRDMYLCHMVSELWQLNLSSFTAAQQPSLQ